LESGEFVGPVEGEQAERRLVPPGGLLGGEVEAPLEEVVAAFVDPGGVGVAGPAGGVQRWPSPCSDVFRNTMLPSRSIV
jgi:hypothetical protein